MNAPVGIGLQICATFFFAIMSALVRLVAQEVPSGEIVFARSLIGLVPVIAWLVISGRMGTALVTRSPSGHVVRGLVGVSAMWMSFGALAFIPLAEAVAFSYATPLVTVVLAAALLGERVPLFRWVVLAVGLAGILLMLLPSFSHAAVGTGREPLIGSALALAGALGAAFAVTQVRHLTRTETSEAIVFYFSLVASCAGLATAPFGWVMPDATTFLVLVAMGLAGGVGQICMTAANRYAPASVVAPLNYATLIWATGLGILMFGEWPHGLVAAGAAVVVASGLALVWRERPGERRRRDRGGPPPPAGGAGAADSVDGGGDRSTEAPSPPRSQKGVTKRDSRSQPTRASDAPKRRVVGW